MSEFNQQRSPLRLFTPLPENTLLPTRLYGNEAVGGSFRFTVDALAVRGKEIDFNELLGKTACVTATLDGGIRRDYHGLVWDVARGDGDEVFDHYSLVLRPNLDKLGLSRRSRIFQDKTALQILQIILEPVGGADFQLLGQATARNICCQYRETDLEFFLRLCSEECLTHYWVHSAEGHKLVITDDTSKSPSQGDVLYDQRVGGTTSQTHLRTWRLRQQLTPSSVSLLDSHFQFARLPLEGTAKLPETVQAGKRDLRLQRPELPANWEEDGVSHARFFDGVMPSGQPADPPLNAGRIGDTQQALAGKLARAASAQAIKAQAVGNCVHLQPGHSFNLSDLPEQKGSWLVVTGEHTLSVDGRYWAGEETSLKVDHELTAAPLALHQAKWPPLPRPKVAGFETAQVIGPKDQEVFVDKFGRVRVRFWWDREEGAASCWVRVAQIWAGNTWGAMFWPRVGHEVLVGFEQGDPDRPVITGSLYNSANMPPYELPGNVYISGFKSCTEGGNPSENFHNILMCDEKGDEVILLHAEKELVSNQESREFRIKPHLDFFMQG